MSGQRTAVRGAALDPALEASYLHLIEARYGLRPSPHAARGLPDALQEALAQTDCVDAGDLYTLLASGRRPEVLDHLAGSLTVGETHFYRVGPQVEALRQAVLPELIRRRARQRHLRIWSAGCSTGEEPYTLAILVRELLPAPSHWTVEIVGTDVDRTALDAASQATYREWAFRGTPNGVRERYFIPGADGWRLLDSIRAMVRFGYLNLASTGRGPDGRPDARFDLIVCRNVTIYLTPSVTRRVYQRFGELLAPDGWLVLGPADPTPEPRSGLTAVPFNGAVLWRLAEAAGSAPPATGPAAPQPGRSPAIAPSPAVPVASDSAARHQRPPRASRPSAVATTAPEPPDVAALHAVLRGGDRTAARAAAERLVASRPLDAEAHLVLGLLYLEDGAAAHAAEHLRRATFLAAENALAQFSLGRAMLELGDRNRARAAFLQARRALLGLDAGQPVGVVQPVLAGELRAAVEAELRRLVTTPRV